MKISIIMPAYNEEKRIGNTLKEYSHCFEKSRKNKKLDYEILVVINNTKDNTEKVVKSYSRKNKRIIYLNLVRGGKGYAVIEGFKDALKRDNDLIGFVDADLATPPEQYFRLVENIGDSDGAIANRYLKGSKITPEHSFRRSLVGRGFNFLVRSLFLMSHTDTQCGAKVFTRSSLKNVLPEMTITEWAFDIDLLYAYKRNGFKVISVPTVWYEKQGSKLRIGRVSLQMFLAVLQLRLLRSKFKDLIRVIKPIISPVYTILKKH